jgi:hypothetical protein
MRRGLGWVALLPVCFALNGCLLDYTPWGQAKASQKRVAAQRMPGRLREEEVGTALPSRNAPNARVERLRIRAYATPHYEAALVDGQAQFEQALSDANPTLAHDLEFRLELTEFRTWPRNLPDDDLGVRLQLLEQDDPGADVDWVVILASPRHVVAASADQIGLASMLGHHLALRAMSDADEFDVIERGFSELSESEKSRLYAARKRHKAATVLLHELGHTLGVPHELDPRSLMSFQYSPQATDFSPVASRLARRVLELRRAALGTELSRNGAQAALNVLKSAPPHTWEADSARGVERTLELLSRYGAGQSVSPAATAGAVPPATALSAPVAAAAPPSPSPSDVSAADRARFEQARAEYAAGRIREARALAAPLFQRYPKSYAVQELRCQLAMKAGLPMADESAECDPLRRLSGAAL